MSVYYYIHAVTHTRARAGPPGASVRRFSRFRRSLNDILYRVRGANERDGEKPLANSDGEEKYII